MHIHAGESFPLGAKIVNTSREKGINFCIFSQHAQGIELLLFENDQAPQPSHTIKLDPQVNRTYHYWHIFVSGLKAGQVYAYRAYGEFSLETGNRYDGDKVLLDPYARAIVGENNYDREKAKSIGDNCANALRCVVVDNDSYDWEDDVHPRVSYAETVIYEMHVGGFTKHPSSGLSESMRGTYAGMIEKIPYLVALGITTVELLPVHYFEQQDAKPGLTNYWGYSTTGFFAPHGAYSSRKDAMGPVDEFRDLVKALHKANIEVILDVVFNHTSEGDHKGPTQSFKGLDNQVYYILEDGEPELYKNYAGCGNTIKANHPIVAQMIIDSLKYWVSEMHVDGFRFDLATILARTTTGEPLSEGHGAITVLSLIEADPVLAGTKLIAEAWDAGGLYSVGRFFELAHWFGEWNGPFRDDVRQFIKGDKGSVNTLAARLLGSPDIYRRSDADKNRCVNFVTCHDGFSLNDVVSYNGKNNLANGEDNRDGSNDNFSWNCGAEGLTVNSAIEQIRLQQIKNFMTVLFLSQGTPMLLMGDEVRHTQGGNNNTYCQDNELSWFDWGRLEQHKGLLRFVQKITHFTKNSPIFNHEEHIGVATYSANPHIHWHGVNLDDPDWGEDSRSLAFCLSYPKSDERIYVVLNAFWEPLAFELPLLSQNKKWCRIVDTSLDSPNDFIDFEEAPMVDAKRYLVKSRASIVLKEKKV